MSNHERINVEPRSSPTRGTRVCITTLGPNTFLTPEEALAFALRLLKAADASAEMESPAPQNPF